MSDFRKKLFDPLAWLLSSRELSKMMTSDRSMDSSIKTIRNYIGRGYYARINASQHDREIKELCQYVQDLNPATIVEIGTRKGGTLYLWCRTNPQVNLIISIDLPGGEFGDGYHANRVKLYQKFVSDMPKTKMHLLREDSHSPSTRDKFEKLQVLGALAPYMPSM